MPAVDMPAVPLAVVAVTRRKSKGWEPAGIPIPPLPPDGLAQDTDPETILAWLKRARPPWEARRGMPFKPYVHRPGEAERTAQIDAQVAAAQALAAERFEEERRQVRELGEELRQLREAR